MKQAPPMDSRIPTMSDAARDIIAGGCAGMASTSALYPMDTIRTRLQMSGSQGKTQSVRSCIAGTVRNEGVRALYKGMAFPFAAQAAFKVVIFTTNGIARRVLDKRGLAESPAGIFACGALAGGVNSLIVAPVELVRTRLMLQFGRDTRSNPSSIKGPVDCVRRIVRHSGVRGMWQGLRVAFARDSLGMGVFFLAIDTTKRVLTRCRHGDMAQKGPTDLDILLLAGSAGGLTFWTVALPADMTKTIIQAAEPKPGEPVPGAVATVTRVFREGGFRRFYMGWPMAFGRGIPGAAIMLATYTYVWRALDGRTLAPAIPAAGNVA